MFTETVKKMAEKQVEKKVELPEGFKAEVEGNRVLVSGSGKQAEKTFKANRVSFKQENGSIVITGKPASRKINAVVNTIVSHINNMVQGLSAEYTYRLKVVYSHFPMNIAVKGNIVEINNFVGEKKARTAKIVEGVSVTAKGKEITVKSHSKEAAGQTAANIENAAKVKGKDKRIYQDGIFIVEKAVQEKKEEGK